VSHSVTVSPAGSPPAAAFTISPGAPTVGQTVKFSDASTGSPTSWAWSFGDGSASTSQNPTHVFSGGGTFKIALKATNAEGSSTSAKTITVSVAPPVAGFTVSTSTPTTVQTVTFTDASTNTPTAWAWTFGDGTTSSLQNPTHVYATTGAYTVALTASNAGGSSTFTKTITVTQAPPVAGFSVSTSTPTTIQTVTFTDASTNAPTAWAWTFGDGTTSSLQNPTHVYATAGSYSAILTATNAGGSSTSTKAITVTQAPPVAAFSVSTSTPTTIQTVTFTDASTNAPTAWAWTFGDGTTSTVQNPTHVYATAGAYTATLTASNAGGSSTSTKAITVTQAPPVAAFSVSTSTPTTIQTVTFTDASTNAPTAWAWTFGDGSTTTAQNPTHVYATAGAFTASLTATNTGGSSTSTKSITVTQAPPVAAFSVSTSTPTTVQTVAFTDSSTNAPTAWAWSFGDGSTSSLQNPTHIYAAAGTYTATLTATNAGGSSTSTQSITVTVAPPVAGFGVSTSTPTTAQTVTFTDASTNAPTAWAWIFGDGSTSSLQNPTHVYATAGAFTATLTASNAGGSSTSTKTITVTQAPPVAGFSVSTSTPTTVQAVTFTDASTSAPTAWAWTFGDGSTSTVQNPTHIYATAGSYIATLVATNAGGSSTSTRAITVTVAPPVAGFGVSTSTPTTIQTVTFTDASTNAPTAWAWTFGDGSTSTVQNPTHIYATAGSYPATLVASNAGGSSTSTKTITVTVPVAPGTAFSFAPSSPVEGQTVTFTDASTNLPTSWAWNFGGDGTSTSQNPTHVFSKAGTYSVVLKATNSAGSKISSMTVVVTVPPPPVATFTCSPSAPTTVQTVTFTDASTNTPTSWAWYFGDGTTSTSQNPTHLYATAGSYIASLTATNSGGSSTTTKTLVVTAAPATPISWKFAMVGDTHVTSSSYAIPMELVTAMLADAPSLLLVAGDIVEGGSKATSATLETELNQFQTVMAPLTSAGIPVYPVRGNHEDDATDDLTAWNAVFTGTSALPSNGPSGEENLTYSFTKNNALFIGLDDYVNIHRVNQTWLDAQFSANTRPHVFVFGHEAAFKVRHDDCLDDYATERDTFWKSLSGAGAKIYLCGHDHFFDLARIDDGDGNTGNDLLQCLVGTGGGELFTQSSYNGDNSTYTPVNMAYESEFGYLLVEISGTGNMDLDVTLTWKKRTLDSATGTYSYVPAYTYSYTASPRNTYPIVDTNQTKFYGTIGAMELSSAPASTTDAFYGEDAQFTGAQPTYRNNGNGTITDPNTGLMWVAARGPQMTWAEAVAGASSCTTAGYTDWRMPTVKETYSLIDFNGNSGDTDAECIPYINTNFFEIVFGDVTGDRVIDGQDLTATHYVSTTMSGSDTAFGVNFIDGRIKGYPTSTAKYVRYVRGNTSYGLNQFVDNGDGTITDKATLLMWAQADSGTGMNWQAALAWVQTQNAANYLGHSDWRLPNAKELQSLVDYTRSPDTTSSAAIDPLFTCTPITNEGGNRDFPFYWTGTTHLDTPGYAVYVCFGRALGWMKQSTNSYYTLMDVHGAGAQRSDPKEGSPTDFYLGVDVNGNPAYGGGPQGDVKRIDNFVRLVRNSKG